MKLSTMLLGAAIGLAAAYLTSPLSTDTALRLMASAAVGLLYVARRARA